MPETLLTFDEAMNIATAEGKKPHLLLGNGFSRACMDDVFDYETLLRRADFGNVSANAWQAFHALGTNDFEEVMRSLNRSAELLEVYDPQAGGTVALMTTDAAGLQEVLISAIANSHPGYPGEISNDAYAACRRFLVHFNRIFTVNYDLLLYWALMQNEIEPQINFDDGFRTPDVDEATYVTWEPKGSRSQNVYYLHGALHLFDADVEVQKFTWLHTQVPLIEQVRAAMTESKFPIFVSEGTPEHKLRKIVHSDYLSSARRSFSRIGGQYSLFVFGHSFSPADKHISRDIGNSSLPKLFVSVYGDPESPSNVILMERVRSLRDVRSDNNALEVYFYAADSANLWGKDVVAA